MNWFAEAGPTTRWRIAVDFAYLLSLLYDLYVHIFCRRDEMTMNKYRGELASLLHFTRANKRTTREQSAEV